MDSESLRAVGVVMEAPTALGGDVCLRFADDGRITAGDISTASRRFRGIADRDRFSSRNDL